MTFDWGAAKLTTWWLSFAGEEGFRGACIVEAPSFLLAHMVANFAGANPGGEMRGHEIDPVSARLIPEKWKNRLLSRQDIDAFDAEMETIDPPPRPS
jgi:hypothetical protein